MIEQLLAAGVLISLTASIFSVLLSAGTAMRVSLRPTGGIVPSGLEVGELVATEELRALVGSAVDEILVGPTVIAFATSGCRPCREMVESLNGLLAGGHTYALIMVEPVSNEVQSLAELAAFEATWVRDPDRTLHRAFKSTSTPHVFLVLGGRIVETVHGGNIEGILRAASALVKQPSSSGASVVDVPALAGPRGLNL